MQGATLYHALMGRTLYQVQTADLRNDTLTPAQLGAKVVGRTTWGLRMGWNALPTARSTGSPWMEDQCGETVERWRDDQDCRTGPSPAMAGFVRQWRRRDQLRHDLPAFILGRDRTARSAFDNIARALLYGQNRNGGRASFSNLLGGKDARQLSCSVLEAPKTTLSGMTIPYSADVQTCTAFLYML